MIGEDKSNTTIDGSGTGSVVTVTANDVYISGFTIRNGSGYGIFLYNSSGTTISDNNISNNGFGVELVLSSGCIITANMVSDNKVQGIKLDGSGGTIMEDNNMTCNKYNFGVVGLELQDFIQEIGVSNTVDGKTVYYLINERDMIIDPSTFPGIGYLGIVNSTNITVKDLKNMTKNVSGIMFAFTKDSILQNVTALENAYGISLCYSNNITIVGSRITSNDEGVCMWVSSDCIISGNTVANNYDGIYPHASNNNTIIGNAVEGNTWGIYFDGFPISGNKIYHNKFINGSCGGFITGSMNTWDDGYPSGGNYWHDYTGKDLYSGLSQNETGGDGIGDTPYTIDANNRDRYPLMNAFEVRNVSWETKTYPLGLFSNSTISEINFDQPGKNVYFNVTGPNGTIGFCRIAIPKTFMWCDPGHPEQWNVTVGSSSPTYLRVGEDANYTYLYFVYSQSTRDVIVMSKYVVPEFSTWTLMFLVFAVVSVVLVLYKRKLPSHGQP